MTKLEKNSKAMIMIRFMVDDMQQKGHKKNGDR